MPDEIIRELWAVKDQLAREANYGIDELCRRLKARDRETSAPVIDLSKKRRRPFRAAQG